MGHGEPSWRLYKCQNCGGIVPAWSKGPEHRIKHRYSAHDVPLTRPQAQTDPSQPTPAVQRWFLTPLRSADRDRLDREALSRSCRISRRLFALASVWLLARFPPQGHRKTRIS